MQSIIEEKPNTELQGKNRCEKIFKSKQFIKSNSGKYNCFVDMPLEKIMSKTFLKSHNHKLNILERLNKTVNRQNHTRSKTQASSNNQIKVSKSFKSKNDTASFKKMIAEKSQILQQEKLIKRYKIFRKNKSKSLKLFSNTKELQRKQFLIQRVRDFDQNQVRLTMNKTQITHANPNLTKTFNQRIIRSRLKMEQSKNQSKSIRVRTEADGLNESKLSNYQPSISAMQTITTEKSSIQTKTNQTPKSKAKALEQIKKNEIFVPIIFQNKVISEKQKNGSTPNSNRKTQEQKVLYAPYLNQVTYQLLRAKQKDQNLQRQLQRIRNYFDTKVRFNSGPNSADSKCEIPSKQENEKPKGIQSGQNSQNMAKTSISGQKGVIKLRQIGKILRQKRTKENSDTNKAQICNPHNPQQNQPLNLQSKQQSQQKQQQTFVIKMAPSKNNTIQIHDNVYRKQIIVVDQHNEQEAQSQQKALKEQRELTHQNNVEDVVEVVPDRVERSQSGKSQIQKIQQGQTAQSQDKESCIIF